MAAHILKLPEVKARTGLSRSAIYALIAEGEGAFPRQIRLGGVRSVGWLESEISAWVDARVAERDATKDATRRLAGTDDWKAKLRARKGAKP